MKTLSLRSIVTAFGAALFLVSGVAVADVDLSQSKVSATFKQMNVPTEGTFGKFTARIDFDPAHADQGSVRMTIDIASFDLGDRMYNDQVAGKDWFDARSYPQATFVSSAIVPAGDGKYAVNGTLTIKGKAEAVTVPVTATQRGATQIFDGALPIKRLAFGIGAGDWQDTSVVADEVRIQFHIVNLKCIR